MGYAVQLRADDVARESGPKQAAIKPRELGLADRAAHVREVVPKASANERRLVGLGKHRGDGSLDMAVRNAPGSQLASDAKAPLASRLRVRAGVIRSVAGIVEIVVLAQARDYARDVVFRFRATLEILAHLVDRVRASHQSAQRRGVKLLLCSELAWRCPRAHGNARIAGPCCQG